MTDDFSVPNAPNDEIDLIACCLNGWPPAEVDIRESDFDQPRHAAVWRAICAAAESGVVSPASVRLALGPSGDKAAVWLMDVFARPVVPANAPAFAARIVKATALGDLQRLGQQLIQRATADDADPELLNTWARERLQQPTGVTRHMETIGDALPRVIDQIQTGQQAGLDTPWPDLDRLIHGLAEDRLYIVAARPGVGKSLLAQNLAMHWSTRHKLPVFFASLEMSADELTTRALAQSARVPLDALLSGDVTEGQWDAISGASPEMLSSRVHVCDDAGQTIDQIRSGARAIQRRHGLGLVIVDYLQLVTPRDRRVAREQQVSEVSRGLKLLAKELHVPVVALSQVRRLNDGEKNRRPTLSDLRESGAIEQDADVVMILHMPDEQNDPWHAELLVAKARAGRRDAVDLHMATHFATIASAARPQSAIGRAS